jgi:hypothetical protein
VYFTRIYTLFCLVQWYRIPSSVLSLSLVDAKMSLYETGPYYPNEALIKFADDTEKV